MGVCFQGVPLFFCLTQIGTNMAKLHVGEKNDWQGMKKGGKMHIFSPIDLKYTKLQQQKTEKL